MPAGNSGHMDTELVENWFPKTFSERIDVILLYLNARIAHIGQQISLSYQELLSLLFIDRQETARGQYSKVQWRNGQDCSEEVEYMLEYLQNCDYIEYTGGPDENESIFLRLTPRGYSRIDELQKNVASGRNVLVAMKFGDDTKQLREAIRKGIFEAGYLAVFIDEVHHNNFITPELLKYMRDSKFVVDLTHQNNGAYFEEGYAMGLPWLSVMVGLPWTAHGTVCAFYLNMAKSDHKEGGITYESAKAAGFQADSPSI